MATAKRKRTLYDMPIFFGGRGSEQNIADDAICNLDGQYATSKREFKSLYCEAPKYKYIVEVTVRKVKA